MNNTIFGFNMKGFGPLVFLCIIGLYGCYTTSKNFASKGSCKTYSWSDVEFQPQTIAPTLIASKFKNQIDSCQSLLSVFGSEDGNKNLPIVEYRKVTYRAINLSPVEKLSRFNKTTIISFMLGVNSKGIPISSELLESSIPYNDVVKDFQFRTINYIFEPDSTQGECPVYCKLRFIISHESKIKTLGIK